MDDGKEILDLCDDGESLAKMIVRFRERVKRGMKFDDVLMHLERADKSLADRMNLVADFLDVEISNQDKEARLGTPP